MDSLTSERANEFLGTHEDMLDGSTSFAKQMQLRQAAKEASALWTVASGCEHQCCERACRNEGRTVQETSCAATTSRARMPRTADGMAPLVFLAKQGERSTLWLIHSGVPMTALAEGRCEAGQRREFFCKMAREFAGLLNHFGVRWLRAGVRPARRGNSFCKMAREFAGLLNHFGVHRDWSVTPKKKARRNAQADTPQSPLSRTSASSTQGLPPHNGSWGGFLWRWTASPPSGRMSSWAPTRTCWTDPQASPGICNYDRLPRSFCFCGQ